MRLHILGTTIIISGIFVLLTGLNTIANSSFRSETKNNIIANWETGDHKKNPEINSLLKGQLLASTYLGGWCDDINFGPQIEIDIAGNVYLSGFTCSTDFPVSENAFQTGYAGGTLDCFVSKFNNNIDTLLASTFLGGSGFETECAITIDENGNIYVAGYTNSTNFPTTSASYSESNSGGYDIFISKLSNDLSTLIASTYVGGTDNEGFDSNYIDIGIDGNGDVIIVGQSKSDDFPVTEYAFDTTFNGFSYYNSGDVVVIKLNDNLTTLKSSTYLGGNADEFRVSFDFDPYNNIIISTGTRSSNMPITENTYDATFNGLEDVYVAKLSNDLSSLIAATYLGSNSNEVPHMTRVKQSGCIYISGYTLSSNFPVTTGAFEEEKSGGEDGFITKLNNDLNILEGSTFLGGSEHDRCQAITIHNNGEIYVTGKTLSEDFPTIEGMYNETFNGGEEHGDIFISQLDSGLTILKSSTYLGGIDDEKPFGIVLDLNDNIFIGGFTHSEDYPIATGAFDTNFHGIRDVVVSKLNMIPDTISSLPKPKLAEVKIFPNPFTNSTTIEYQVKNYSKVSLMIVDLNGKEVKTLISGFQTPGIKTMIWDASNNSGSSIPSGIYNCRIQIDDNIQSKKIIIAR